MRKSFKTFWKIQNAIMTVYSILLYWTKLLMSITLNISRKSSANQKKLHPILKVICVPNIELISQNILRNSKWRCLCTNALLNFVQNNYDWWNLHKIFYIRIHVIHSLFGVFGNLCWYESNTGFSQARLMSHLLFDKLTRYSLTWSNFNPMYLNIKEN